MNSLRIMLQRWGEMTERGFVDECGLTGDVSVACLDGWCRTVAADLAIAEALKGQAVWPTEQLSSVIEASTTTVGQGWLLNRCWQPHENISLCLACTEMQAFEPLLGTIAKFPAL